MKHPFNNIIKYSLICLLISFLFISQVSASSSQEAGQLYNSIVHSLDYVSVDYPGVIENGKVINEGEYAEQLEIAQHALTLIQTLPGNPQKLVLIKQAQKLQQSVQELKSANEVTSLCRETIAMLISSYQVKITPSGLPSLEEGKQLFSSNCTACHGMNGLGDGKQATLLSPKPANFHDRSRQQYRNIYALYNTISLGVDNTAMSSFSQLSAAQRWSLAFYVSNFYATDAEIAQGAQLWQQEKFNQAVTSMQQLTQAKPAEVEEKFGKNGVAVLAYLRANPQVFFQGKLTPLNKARNYLIASLNTYKQGKTNEAYKNALAAYFEGFELAEAKLKTVAPDLRIKIEHEMTQYRNLVKVAGNTNKLEKQQQLLLHLFGNAEQQLNTTSASASVSFITSMLILLREGLEAILVLAAIVSVLVKSNRRDALRYINAGWIGALFLGLLTWYAAAHFISIDGANRELTEGITALIAASMLFYVGFWLHNQSNAMQWKKFVHEKIGSSLSEGALWGLTFIAFLAVYREVFESVLFYQSLMINSPASQHNYIIGGITVAAGLLVILAWLIMRYSVRLPLRTFFRVNMILMFLLAIVFAGKGVASMQEAGIFPVNPVNFPQIELLGIFPNMEALGLQLVLICFALAWSRYNYKKAKTNKT